MNRTLPPGDSGNRSGTASGQFRCRWPLPCALGLVRELRIIEREESNRRSAERDDEGQPENREARTHVRRVGSL
jgi:hypothetical protein